ncbi:MAG: GGDEF domain-containing protein [Desulfobulbaceae bacterium]|nr:MAG: GGDEF domain-containing protein [Desulfobulbaceae bacterium]
MKINIHSLKSFFDRLINPRRWSLQIRVVYTTGLILLAGAAMTLFTISYVLHIASERTIENRLNDFHLLISRETTNRQAELIMLNTQLTARNDFTTAFSSHEIQQINVIIRLIEEHIRLSTNYELPVLQLYTQDIHPLYNSRSLSLPISAEREEFGLVEESAKRLESICGHQVISADIFQTCASPVIIRDIPIGIIESSISLDDVFSPIDLPTEYGISVVLSAEQSPILKTGISDLELSKNRSLEMRTRGSIYAKNYPLIDWQQNEIGQVILYFDADDILSESRSTIIYMSWITIIGVLLLSFSLYWNVKRITGFFNQMKAVLIGSHSKDFSERFPAVNSVNCAEMLECSHLECPLYNNPDKICYLETGDKAISPRYRNACIALNKYGSCESCPVYSRLSGDEMAELRYVVNTVMALWENFLDKVGRLLADVFRTTSGNMPSLEDISGYLEQMAALTSYSHDLHGVYSKEEVYRLLEWVFEKQFGLTQFNLLEVSSSDNKMIPVINRFDIEESHREVYLNCELCRAKRVAQDVMSDKSPFLCPYFGIETSIETRCCIPMVMGGRVGAVFTFVVPKNIWEQKKSEIPIIKKYLDETAPILSSLRLLQISKEQALRDPLTQCYNRRFMDEYLKQLEHQQSRKPQNIGFIMADLDHFKMVNDEFGHLAGDEILKQLSIIIKQNIRKSDLLIRYGGEEFLIILLDIKEPDTTFDIAEKIRIAIEDAKFALPAGGVIRKTLSMGTARFPADADQFYQTIKYADVALYQAKEQGRNRVLQFLPEMWVDESY